MENLFGMILNKYVLAIASLITPIVAIISYLVQDSVFLVLALIVMVSLDTMLGMYIAIKKGKFSSSKNGFWRIGDKMISYFSLIIIMYTIVIITQVVPYFNGDLTVEALRYLIYFTFSIMYGRETLSIFESIDVLQPNLLPESFKNQIARIFNKKL